MPRWFKARLRWPRFRARGQQLRDEGKPETIPLVEYKVALEIEPDYYPGRCWRWGAVYLTPERITKAPIIIAKTLHRHRPRRLTRSGFS